MPELPEVETIRIGLSKLLPGKTIVGVWHDWPKSFPNSEIDVKEFLIGAKVLEVKRRAKVLLIELDSKYSLVIHLKMTGQLVFVAKNLEDRRCKIEDGRAAEKPTSKFQLLTSKDEVRFGAGHPNDSLIGKLPDKSTRVIFDFATGDKLFFNDQRKFGWVRLLPTAEVPNIDFFKKVGPELLDINFTAKDFEERLRRRPNSGVKAVILDQSVIAGVGNIYADESLWAAKIHPATPINKLTYRSIHVLFDKLTEVLRLSIEKGGSTDKNYVNAEGKKGSYLNFANVFRREGQPCPRCSTIPISRKTPSFPDRILSTANSFSSLNVPSGTSPSDKTIFARELIRPGNEGFYDRSSIIIKIRVAGRGTHICPTCQKPVKAKS
ncbi:bifunctional DNA-formamidopyrimidine glycosylase/DNA-(apurinic or apyrimidinic site) lyase [Candidatus Saccharibacteria bacterium]|nr:bifunctional DNA-formamidopyrimidine glycosylase/DNA-(apurinic or apyrimidinic site) lyase [Candidatus Saccharibacteria bacterium]MBI3338486.1 bifunctional DNA-formamidopyrimidine glycosylase/DNA-(apurinic or apyrimidinic site) lyase [Candidatus Saccharibacteria bacterium]